MSSSRPPVYGQPVSAATLLPPRFELSEPGDSRPVLRCQGELDSVCVAELAAALDAACEREITDLLLDFSAVAFIDARILALIVECRARLEGCGASLRISAGGQPLRLLRLTGVLDGDAEPAPRLQAWADRSSSSSSPTNTSGPNGVAMTL
jgi:anti-anti-sigma factor